MIENNFLNLREKKWDVIIIGAGTVGLLLASLLVDKGKKVLCLESGDLLFDPKKQDLNNGIVTGENHQGIYEARARIVGGTSTLWGGQLAKFSSTDFERNDEFGNKKWLFNYDEMEMWYEKVAKTLAVSSYEKNQSETLKKIFGNNILDERRIEFYATHWLKVPNIYRYFKSKIDASEDFAIYPNCHVRKLISNGVTVTGAEVVYRNGDTGVLHAKNFILANGTMEISRLLLLSIYFDSKVPWASNYNIGCFFQDHIDVECGQLLVTDNKRFDNYFENAVINGNKVQPKIRLNQDNFYQSSSLNVAGSIRFESRFQDDLIYLKTMIKSCLQPGGKITDALGLIRHLSGVAHIWWPLVWKYLKSRRIIALKDGGVFLRAHMEQSPIRSSRIELDLKDTDVFDLPKLKLHWEIDWVNQIKNLQIFCKSSEEFFRVNGFGDLKIKQQIIDGDLNYLRENYRDSFHQCGGAIMSTSSRTGVVDKNCRVHGTSNLYVAGAAVFPTSSYANPTFTAMALATRLAEFI